MKAIDQARFRTVRFVESMLLQLRLRLRLRPSAGPAFEFIDASGYWLAPDVARERRQVIALAETMAHMKGDT